MVRKSLEQHVGRTVDDRQEVAERVGGKGHLRRVQRRDVLHVCQRMFQLGPGTPECIDDFHAGCGHDVQGSAVSMATP